MEHPVIGQARQVTLPEMSVEVPEWADQDGEIPTVKFRQLTRGHIDDIQAWIAGKGDEIVPADIFGQLALVYAFAEPDLVTELGVDEALEVLRAQPLQLLTRLAGGIRDWTALDDDAPKGSKTK